MSSAQTMSCPHCGGSCDPAQRHCGHCGRSLAGLLRPGSQIANRYEVVAVLGRGGMGTVYKAHDRKLDELVAIKVLRADLADSPGLEQRFLAEIKLARKVTHPNVCRIHEYGEHADLRFISMELVSGADLRQVIQSRGLRTEEALGAAVQIASGLEAIHHVGIIHRDLKTPNIMLDDSGQVRLMDFGIAKQWELASSGGITSTGQIVGTPEYMSPEQARGEKVDFRSDIYALGIVLFELFTGRVPFSSESPLATLYKHLNEPPPLTGPGAERIPAELVDVLAKMLQKDPAARYATAGEVVADLQEARARFEASPERREGATVEVPQPDEATAQILTPPSLPSRTTPSPRVTELRPATPVTSPEASGPYWQTEVHPAPRPSRNDTPTVLTPPPQPSRVTPPPLPSRATPAPRPPLLQPPAPRAPAPLSRPMAPVRVAPSPRPAAGAERSSIAVLLAMGLGLGIVLIAVGVGVWLMLDRGGGTTVAEHPAVSAPATVPTPTRPSPTREPMSASATSRPDGPLPVPQTTVTPTPARPTAAAATPVTTIPAAPRGGPVSSPPSKPTLVVPPTPQPARTPVSGAAAGDPGSERQPTGASAPGTLKLAVSPWAEVTIEGRSLGSTPIRPVSLPPGTYVVRLTHPDFHPLQRKITIRSGDVTRLEIDLTQDAFPRNP